MVRLEGAERDEFFRLYGAVQARLAPLGERDEVRWLELLRFLLSWVVRRRSADEKAELIRLTADAQADVRRRAEVQAMAEKTFKSAVDVEAEKLAAVRAEQIGERIATEKTVQLTREMLRSLLEDRFGSVPEDLQQAIDRIDDLDRLKAAIRQVVRVQTIAEFRL